MTLNLDQTLKYRLVAMSVGIIDSTMATMATPAMAHDVTNVEVKPHVEVKPTVHVHGSSAGCDVLGGARNLYEVVFNAFDDVHEKAHEVQDNLFGFHI